MPSGNTDKARTRAKSITAVAATASSSLSLTEEGKQTAIQMGNTDRMEQMLEDLGKRMDQLDQNVRVGTGKADEVIGNIANIRKEARVDIDRLVALLEVNRANQAAQTRMITILSCELEAERRRGHKLEFKLNDMENKNRLYNLKIDGKPEDADENLYDFVTELAKVLGVDPEEVQSAYRMGKNANQRPGYKVLRPRPIMITFYSIQGRNNYFYARMKLKDSVNFRNIYMNDDVTPLTHKQRDEFRSVAAMARSAGNLVKVHSDGILINGTKYRHSDPDMLPDEFSLEKAKIVRQNDGLYFQSEHAFLSNFHKSSIVIDGIHYPTAEHCYQASKCRQAGDHARLSRVMKAGTPLEAKKIADQMSESDEWKNNKHEVMTKVIQAKFEQNPSLATKLLDTGNDRLYEATKNSFFGIGASLHSKELRDLAYKGQNKLGQALEALRQSIRNQAQTNQTANQPTHDIPDNIVL